MELSGTPGTGLNVTPSHSKNFDPLLNTPGLASNNTLPSGNKAAGPSATSSAPPNFGATVHLLDENDNKIKYQIVGETEADARLGRISYASPLGRALIGRMKGEEVEFSAPSGDKYYEIKKIQFV